MAYSGTGTAADPYIVDNWDDFLVAAQAPGTGNNYVKWADYSEEEKVVELVTISSNLYLVRLHEVDFNGWKFEKIDVTINSTSANCITTYVGGDLQIYNWHVKLWTVKNFRTGLTNSHTDLHRCYFDEVRCQPVSSTSDFWKGTFINHQFFENCFFHESIIRTKTEGCNFIVPNGYFENSEVWIDYKYTGTTAKKSKNSVFTMEISLVNSYLGGKVDVAEGSGSFAITFYDRSSGAALTNSIINIEFIVSASCTISAYNANTTFRQVSNSKSYFVLNNGNNEGGLVSVPTWLKCQSTAIRTPETLTTDNFPYINDDDARYSQFNGNASENWSWRQTVYINDGVPFLPFWFYPIYEPPVIYPIERAERISVYDILEPQNGFDHNGLAILFPSEVISYKEDMGRWDLELTHPIDPYGKWSYIVGQNTVKVNGQIFRIDETELYSDANQQYIKAHANHITYDLNDKFVGDASFSVSTGLAYEAQLMLATREMVPSWEPTPYEYQFEFTSDITGTLVADVHDQTVTGALYGDDNSFATRYGGHLYRDNFHLSINTVQENLPAAPAFQLRFGTDLTKLSYKIDFSSWITELICENNFGELWAITYDDSEWIVHHHKTKRIHFTYPPGTPNTLQTLIKDGEAYWETVSTPKISIEVAVANLKNDPKYKDFLDLQNLDVGYTGTVYFQQFNIEVNLKIVSIKRNELTGEAINIVLGNAPNSLIRSPVMSQTIVPNSSVESKQAQTVQAMQKEIENVKLKSMRLWSGIRSYTWADVNQYKWEEIKNGRRNS
ncbi:MAG: hypothetical protein K5898_03660 [Ruminococcus sp.]|uniref:phage tail spike protein n=1 Tax=Ruminococcus sp. TaxID=41978 RepID=UPI0025DAD8E1|nr:phage tail spike protein [Ruminococcus sp.]MCR4794264.1 hypothetical protein [Ruminococcus sp.]